MVENLAPPYGSAIIYIVLTVAFLVILVLWMSWRITRLNEKPRLASIKVNTWRKKIDKLHASHRTHGDTRVFSLALAKLLRDFGTERSGVNMASMSATEIEQASGQPAFASLLAELEEPSFSPGGTGELATLTERAKAAVGSW